jgi:hypothetical protein
MNESIRAREYPRTTKTPRKFPRIVKNPRHSSECQLCGETVAAGKSCVSVEKGKRVHHECFQEWSRKEEMEEEYDSQ